MEGKVSSLEEKVDETDDYQIDPEKVEKNNLRIDGVAEENGEAWACYDLK